MPKFLFDIWDDLEVANSYGRRYEIYYKIDEIAGIAALVAIIAAVIIYFTFLSKRNVNHFRGFTNWLYEALHFRKLMVEALLKITYLFFAIFLTIISITTMTEDFLTGLLCLIVFNVGIRIAYEFLLIIVMICKNVSEINRKMKEPNNNTYGRGNSFNGSTQPPFSQPFGQPMMNRYPQNQGAPMNQSPFVKPMNQPQNMSQAQNMNQPQNMSQVQNMNVDMNTYQVSPVSPVQQTGQQQSSTSEMETVNQEKAQEAPLPEIQNIRSCPKCGTMLEKDDAFCPTCGSDVREI